MNELLDSFCALLDELFPGSDNVPRFSSLSKTTAELVYLNNYSEVAWLYENCRSSHPGEEINTVLRFMRLKNQKLVNEFIEASLEVYFSDPIVFEALTGRPLPLYPNANVLGSFNYNLLEPVYSRNVKKDEHD